MKQSGPHTLALDLEGTLISDATSQIPRPGLYGFLVECGALFRRIVIATTLTDNEVGEIVTRLACGGHAPSWFVEVQHIRLNGSTKDLQSIPNAHPTDVLLVDDCEEHVHVNQRDQWVRVTPFVHPYSRDDRGLEEASDLIRQRIYLPTIDEAWEQLIAKGSALKQELLVQSGGTLSLGEVADLLGISESMVERRRRESKLLAIKIGDQLRYPACQFDNSIVIAGLDEVLPLIADYPWTALCFLAAPSDDLGGRSPLEVLRSKDSELRERLFRMARILEGDGYG